RAGLGDATAAGVLSTTGFLGAAPDGFLTSAVFAKTAVFLAATAGLAVSACFDPVAVLATGGFLPLGGDFAATRAGFLTIAGFFAEASAFLTIVAGFLATAAGLLASGLVFLVLAAAVAPRAAGRLTASFFAAAGGFLTEGCD